MCIEISEIIRSRRRTISIEIKEDARLVVRAPYRIPDEEIKAFIDKKNAWIGRCREEAMRRHLERPRREFAPGEELLYLGKCYKLRHEHGRHRALVLDDAFILSPDHAARAREFFVSWYKEEARSVIEKRAAFFASMASESYSGIKITSARRTWGSCSRRGTLNFSWRIIMAPIEVIDYVIAHEVAHLSEMNHSKRFWSKLEELFPGYKERKRWLRENGHLLTF
jgi:predicted metal-dependent hydrolase